MIKSDKKKMEEELTNKEKILDLRMKSIEKQEDNLSQRLEKLRDELLKSKK